MAKKLNYLCVLDYETTSKYKETCFPVEISARIFNPNSFTPVPGGTFHSMCKPDNFEEIKKTTDFLESIDKTKIPVEEIDTAPPIKIVWNKYIDFVNKYNPQKNKWTAPVACGYNIRGFDLPITERMNIEYSPKKEKTILFSDFLVKDLLDIIVLWFEGTNAMPDYKFDSVREYLGLPSKDETGQAHRAHFDTAQEAAVLFRFMELHKRLFVRIPMKDCFKK